jgi:heat shock protein HtpX
MNDRSFMLFRSLSAIALTIGFYALAFGIVAGILGFDWLLLESGRLGALTLKIFLFSAIALYSIIVAMAPRRDRFEAPGPLLEPSAYPELFALIRDVAARSNQAVPAEVYLTHDLNAWVAERGGFAGMGRRRVMGVGLPLLQTLDVEEFRAVLAHEFGHYHGGDTRVGPWIHKTRAAIGRTLEGLGSSFLRKPFEWYGMLFMRITQSVSRRQEFAADQLGAALAGKEAMASGLKKVHAMGPLSEAYWHQEVLPAVKRGFRPALASGFTEFLQAPRIADAGPRILEEVLKSEATDKYDSHPCLRDRLAALGVDHAPPAPSDRASAATLLGKPADLEPGLFGIHLGINPGQLNPIAWEDSGEKIHRVGMEEGLKPAAEKLAALKFSAFPGYLAKPEALAADLSMLGLPDEPEERKTALSRLLAVHLMLALCARGWRMDSRPGHDVRCLPRDPAVPAVVFPEISAELEKGAAPEAWRARCAAWGLV